MSLANSISEAQKEARRANGRQGRGPKTEEGKARSRQNAIRHGGYARVIDVIGVGPMAEDPNAVVAFYELVMEDLEPGDSVLLKHLAQQAARALWRQLRTQRFEAVAYSDLATGPTGINSVEWPRTLARNHREAAATLLEIGDPDLGATELWNCLSCVGFHPQVRGDDAWTKLAEDSKVDALRSALIQLVDRHYPSFEAAADLMEQRAAELEDQADLEAGLRLPGIVRADIAGGFTQRLLTVIGTVNREAERALDRYRQEYLRLRS